MRQSTPSATTSDTVPAKYYSAANEIHRKSQGWPRSSGCRPLTFLGRQHIAVRGDLGAIRLLGRLGWCRAWPIGSSLTASRNTPRHGRRIARTPATRSGDLLLGGGSSTDCSSLRRGVRVVCGRYEPLVRHWFDWSAQVGGAPSSNQNVLAIPPTALLRLPRRCSAECLRLPKSGASGCLVGRGRRGRALGRRAVGNSSGLARCAGLNDGGVPVCSLHPSTDNARLCPWQGRTVHRSARRAGGSLVSTLATPRQQSGPSARRTNIAPRLLRRPPGTHPKRVRTAY